MQKITKKNYCEICHYSTSNNSDFKKHNSARKHILREKNANLAMLDEEKNALQLNYNCEICKFKTMNKSNYNYHLLTKKHQQNSIKLSEYTQLNNSNDEQNERPILYEKSSETFHSVNLHGNKCPNCNKEYLNYNALWKHKKHCVVTTTQPTTPSTEPLQNTFVPSSITDKNTFTPELFMEVLKQSKELQDVLVEQNKEL